MKIGKLIKKNMSNTISSDNSNLKRILSDICPNKKKVIQDNNYGSQTIFLSGFTNYLKLIHAIYSIFIFLEKFVKITLAEFF